MQQVEQRINERLSKFFHPLYGGNKGTGWNFGEMFSFSDIYLILEKIPNVDHVDNLSVQLEIESEDGHLQNKIINLDDGDQIPTISPLSLIYGEAHEISVRYMEEDSE